MFDIPKELVECSANGENNEQVMENLAIKLGVSNKCSYGFLLKQLALQIEEKERRYKRMTKMINS